MIGQYVEQATSPVLFAGFFCGISTLLHAILQICISCWLLKPRLSVSFSFAKITKFIVITLGAYLAALSLLLLGVALFIYCAKLGNPQKAISQIFGDVHYLAILTAGAIGAYISARLAFAPFLILEEQRKVLRTSWRITREYGGVLFTIYLLFIALPNMGTRLLNLSHTADPAYATYLDIMLFVSDVASDIIVFGIPALLYIRVRARKSVLTN